jgi:imidazolonepropionase-like amidohydrolase
VPGKVADIIIVNGKPAEHVNQLRNVQQVIRGGRLFDIHDLKLATGLARQ